MAGPNDHKRRREEAKRKASLPIQRKKIKKQREYHSSSEDSDGSHEVGAQDFKAVNFLDSDDDNVNIHNAAVDDGQSSLDASDDCEWESEEQSEGSDADSEADGTATGGATQRKPKSKRNDPNAFSTSITKILGTKLSSTRRSDPVLSRSATALEAAKSAEESALESKARRKIREQKKQAKEKGRVRDVLVGTVDPLTGEPEATISEILADEKRLRKIATRGVVKMFNAIRQAQVGAQQAERQNKKQKVLGQGAREEKVAEMSKEAFLDLIAKGGGGLSKRPLQEA
ncbi:RRP15-like protein [Zalerion maritima]|uniref:RRP15-like protein n=1 Tax=Zalerion maritima TaxID=339359 RepID=A0AAD5RPX7_9PEZI|nr:RRP15-like protein [Zalerion maritima]